jgi:hypothetical protein
MMFRPQPPACNHGIFCGVLWNGRRVLAGVLVCWRGNLLPMLRLEIP